MSGDWRLSEEKSSQFRFWFLVGGSIGLVYSAATECVSAMRHARGHNFEVGFLAPPSLCRLRLCHPRYLREGVGGVACCHARRVKSEQLVEPCRWVGPGPFTLPRTGLAMNSLALMRRQHQRIELESIYTLVLNWTSSDLSVFLTVLRPPIAKEATTVLCPKNWSGLVRKIRWCSIILVQQLTVFSSWNEHFFPQCQS